MAEARKALDWEAPSLDPEKSLKYRSVKNRNTEEACTMCGKYCAMKIVSQYLGSPGQKC